jgi:hypothetical protein
VTPIPVFISLSADYHKDQNHKDQVGVKGGLGFRF